MLTKDQYLQLLPYKEHLEFFERVGEWLGGEAPFRIHDKILGGKTNMSCRSCTSATLLDNLKMIRQYEGNI